MANRKKIYVRRYSLSIITLGTFLTEDIKHCTALRIVVTAGKNTLQILHLRLQQLMSLVMF